MKKLLLVALALVALQVNAQDKREDKKELRKDRMERYQNLKPEEVANLQTKKMTLALDLSEAQQKQVEALNLKNAKTRKANMEKKMASKEAKKELSQDEKLKRANDKLDAQIATKREMKKILTPEQYEKYSKMSGKRKMKGKRGKMKHKRGTKKAEETKE
ncbi:hypothetical protein [Lacinutrix chionoecetis]